MSMSKMTKRNKQAAINSELKFVLNLHDCSVTFLSTLPIINIICVSFMLDCELTIKHSGKKHKSV